MYMVGELGSWRDRRRLCTRHVSFVRRMWSYGPCVRVGVSPRADVETVQGVLEAGGWTGCWYQDESPARPLVRGSCVSLVVACL